MSNMRHGWYSILSLMISYRTYIQCVPVTGESSDPKGPRHQQDREHDWGVISEGRDGQMGRKGTPTYIPTYLLIGALWCSRAPKAGQMNSTSSFNCCTAQVTALLIDLNSHLLFHRIIDPQEVDRLRKRKSELEESMARSKHSAPTRQQVSARGVRTRYRPQTHISSQSQPCRLQTHLKP